jgi:hypothetical protein
MLPGEYCTKSVFTRRPQPTQRGASPSVSASPITLSCSRKLLKYRGESNEAKEKHREGGGGDGDGSREAER